MLTALLLALWAYLCIYDILGPVFFLGFRPLIAGFGAGLIVGDVQTGMLIGGTLELMALGVYTYGGATIPDFTVGAILGTFFGKEGGFEVGISLAIPAALLLTQVDILNRFLNTTFVHRSPSRCVRTIVYQIGHTITILILGYCQYLQFFRRKEVILVRWLLLSFQVDRITQGKGAE